MAKKLKNTEPKEATTVTAQVADTAPFDVLKYGDYKVTKSQPIEVPFGIENHRYAEYLIIT